MSKEISASAPSANAPLKLLTVEQAAELLQITPGRLRRLACAGHIPHWRFSKKLLRFDRDELLAAGKQEARND